MTSLENRPDREDIGWLCAADIMQREVVSVRASDTVEEVERILADAGVSGVPVLAADGKVLGVLSTSDLVERYANREDPAGMPLTSVDDDGNDITLEPGTRDALRLTAADMMTPEAETIAPDTNLREVARRMVDGGIHRLLVVEDGRLAGILSTIDILRALADSRPS